MKMIDLDKLSNYAQILPILMTSLNQKDYYIRVLLSRHGTGQIDAHFSFGKWDLVCWSFLLSLLSFLPRFPQLQRTGDQNRSRSTWNPSHPGTQQKGFSLWLGKRHFRRSTLSNDLQINLCSRKTVGVLWKSHSSSRHHDERYRST